MVYAGTSIVGGSAEAVVVATGRDTEVGHISGALGSVRRRRSPVLVVNHDIEVDVLRRAGFEVSQCAGPIGGSECPVLHGMPCW